MKKKFMMLSCIAAVALATVVGKKTYESHAYETNSLLMQNVEALADNDGEGDLNKKGCKTNTKIVIPTDKCIHQYTIGFSGTESLCSEGDDSSCQSGLDGTSYRCETVSGHPEHPGHKENTLETKSCK